MDFDKKTLAAIALVGIILIFIQTDFYQKRFMPRPQNTEIDLPIGGADEPFVSEQQDDRQKKREPQDPVLNLPDAEVASQVTLGPASDVAGKDVVVETNLYRAVFSTRGAVIKSIELKDYFLENGEWVQLIGQTGHGNLGLVFPVAGDTTDTSHFIFEADRQSVKLFNSTDSEQIQFVLDLGDDRRVTKTYTFYPDRYSFDVNVRLQNLNGLIDGFSYYMVWRTGLESTEPDLKTDMENAKAYALQGDAESFDVEESLETETFENPTQWVAIRTKYFATALIPRSAAGQAVRFLGALENVGGAVPHKRYQFDLKMAFDQKSVKEDDYTVYLGPLDYDIVSSYDIRLEEMMDLGWAPFRPFQRVVRWSFRQLHRFIPNYGVVIVVFSILIKILLFPLTRKSYQSMKEMQALQPQMQELNEKYKDDAQRKQQETMKLYKEYGINPLGGCIPMVLQMPLLIALFNVFRTTIDLRGAPFVFWITDLSRPDTIATLSFEIPFYGNTVNVLPLFMGVTMFIQQKMTMKDPKQKALVYMMPVFFTLLFNGFPSGLNLYYSLFNVLSILQEKLIPYKTKSPEELKERKSKSKTKRRRVKHDYRGRTR